MRRAATAIVSIALLCAAGVARGAAIYAAEVTAQLRLTAFLDAGGQPIARPAALGIEGSAEPVDRLETTAGSARADADHASAVAAADPLALGIGDGIDLSAAAAGRVDPPGPGRSDALAATDGLVFLDNRSATETFRVAFELTWAWSLDVTLDAAGAESARADAALRLVTLSGGAVLDLFEAAIGGAGPGARGDAGAFRGELVLGPLGFDELRLVADAGGSASRVPEPATATLFGVALAIALAVRARRAPPRG